ncbi:MULTISPECIES: CcdC family protein [unclassified Bacillus (in: firmicutes)]|uniref:CcdC family protein n=1 Tax=unclassified Bacillus (in: firmicutes) TaxID=185979 RepID=UPI001BE61ECA|nr:MULTISPECIES: cytochrome c biogenesis protein CcdC [unclassified Bacillus (in: firmicutes)]MBT2618072.1 cytochrome c biogenesis protein CcdC [Bacillus sp. ISL-78]MBT2630145.1 cytochrome c biogenesis protein CcdC [Bacillus sp. ISL-101]MBT2718672.1 cytochrome c biogenesis protein CcdC [Bacillus sp. ISL-57]
MIYISTGIAIVMAIGVFILRMKETEKPVNEKKIILPPLFMSTGALMFIFPMFRVTRYELLEALVAGMLFSILLIKTSKFEVRDEKIYILRSKAFIFILIGLMVIRLVAKLMLGSTIEIGVLSGMFFLLAFAMIVPWRIAMLYQYKKVKAASLGGGSMV